MTEVWRLDGVDLGRLDRLASRIALTLKTGDVVTLSGPLGAGKTTLARTLVGHFDRGSEVPSPTFALIQRYETPRLALSHCDFYRLDDGELEELGLDDALADGALLIEWPERAADWLPQDRLDIVFDETDAPETRTLVLTGHGDWAGRLHRLQDMAGFLESTAFADADALYLQGDASARGYARLVLPDRRAVLMNSPRQPDGPPIRDGKPYSALVHLAEDVKPFVAVAEALGARGFSAPEIQAFDLDKGFIVLEDFGDAVFKTAMERGMSQAELWHDAVDVLLALAERPPEQALPVPGSSAYALPRFDAEAMLIEASLIVEWLWPAAQGRALPEEVRAEFESLWRPHLETAASADPGWVLRDFHSPNLMYLQDRDGVRNIGLLDFQDALYGPLAYDVVSVLQDARLDVPEALERAELDRYCAARTARGGTFSSDDFRTLYATLGAQRNSKILGIFARLAKRDGKRAYLGHMPRVARYLERDLAHPALADLRDFYARAFPAAEELPPTSL
ncbi:tRNA (adenosine(37)-N6)-threonylcarbamoyltransferase complex ATPase subunit type 1 TsaE [Methyloceanibacter caenitepidi]|uniref:tRNA threonylcarbamoyladenosine biosynthesis protein TsaE n=1 Tax=Methyloceanibacter caenitepidi TaxID=1384459 RepID=A0A0A8K0J6_9HYPH|nr:tRNA (adenosine(37)-N6)-threonylcarbamoyltransferase complex ATPase subunit type 1 TsaE [Methyloceanibacter caenitepidi]BAQ16032.1 ATPase YjeE, predicted to have essential role in cell wall biosynthesis [Methyloceanibacter caenitepidi]